ncbi:hypothetical protein DDZ14_12220 [Maritimibacter sp. 55A14]|uniref:A24 family peptidase n=1 Tax=Maritimibacter sp. 55A14 TaxID=2174844 RepID=UPI000D621860|nr:prepilin peptidase [Maritimibacter sp. 55A14]PWE31978.1 hypothetical protein DDZ14_12220 [Maritimibacter sp. 55A14]
METTAQQALIFLVIALPISVWVAWSDMKTMRIPNLAVLALTAGFLVLGLVALPLDAYLWRLAHILIVLLAGFLLSVLGLVGAGDAKFAAAMAPFIALGDLRGFAFVLAIVMIAAFLTHRLARATPLVRRVTPDWQSWERKKDFPMGFALGGALVAYLALAAMQHAG